MVGGGARGREMSPMKPGGKIGIPCRMLASQIPTQKLLEYVLLKCRFGMQCFHVQERLVGKARAHAS